MAASLRALSGHLQARELDEDTAAQHYRALSEDQADAKRPARHPAELRALGRT